MAKSINISDEIMAIMIQESRLQSRSLTEQIVHWINIGRAIEQSGRFNYQHVTEALNGKRSPDALTETEQEVWLWEFAELTSKPSEKERQFFETRRKRSENGSCSKR